MTAEISFNPNGKNIREYVVTYEVPRSAIASFSRHAGLGLTPDPVRTESSLQGSILDRAGPADLEIELTPTPGVSEQIDLFVSEMRPVLNRASVRDKRFLSVITALLARDEQSVAEVQSRMSDEFASTAERELGELVIAGLVRIDQDEPVRKYSLAR